MIKYPTIISSTKTEQARVTLCLFIPKDIIFFQGHFPQIPILPGVAQVDWAMFFAKKNLNIATENYKSIEQIKFTNIIKPDTTLFLSLKSENDSLTFKYFNNSTTYSLGKIKI